MPAFLLLSPAGSGKTAALLQRIRQVKAAGPLAPVLVIVPNQLQAAGFRRRLAEAGGALGVEILTFYALYADLLSRAGRPMPALLDPVQIRLLRSIVDDLCECGAMRHYAALRRRPGFLLAIRSTLQELKRARVFPQDFTLAVQGLGPHLEELAAVYAAYQDWLQRQNWADLEGRGWLAAIALEQDRSLGADLRLLVVTGFDEFNPTQLAVLALLAPRARETLISLTGDAKRPERPAHRRFQRARQALASVLDLHVEPLDSYSYLAPPLAHLEANLFADDWSQTNWSQTTVEFIEAQTRSAEARAALRWVKARILRDSLDLSEVAVLGRDLEPYRPFIEEVAVEFGIPLRVAGGLPLAQNPAVAALLSLLALPAKDWPRRPLIEAWRSPYFDWTGQGISPAFAAALDAASRQARVISGQAQWREALDLLESQKLGRRQPLEDSGNDAPPLAGVMESGLREKFDAFCTLLAPPAAGSIREYVAFVEDLIGDDPVEDDLVEDDLVEDDRSKTTLTLQPLQPAGEGETGVRILAQCRANPATAGRDEAALRAFKDVLRGLVLAEAALQGAPLSYAAFYKELRGAVEAATYTVAGERGLLVASVLDARGLSFRAAVLLGLSEGEFPRPEREDPFLSEVDRQELRKRGIPLESRLKGDEGTIFYQALTRTRERLLLTRPYLAEDGQAWEESPYWKQVHHLMGQPSIRRVRPEDAVPPSEAASTIELSQVDEFVRRGRAVLSARMARTGESIYEGDLPSLAESLSARYSESFGWSASKLEAYGTCPFYFYVAYALDLEPRTPPEEGYDFRMLGSMLHEILADTFSQVDYEFNLEEHLARMEAIAGQVFSAAPADYGFRPTPLWAQQRQELTHALRRTIMALAEQSQGYTPRTLERKYGLGSPLLVLHTEIGEIRLHGTIDRVDADAEGRLRVIDYKLGGAAIGAQQLAEGRRLQLPLYALAARDALGLGEVAGGFYWHIQKAEASSLKLEDYDGGVEAACLTAVGHVTRHVANIRAGQFQPQPPSDGCPSYCPAASFCWRYQSKGY